MSRERKGCWIQRFDDFLSEPELDRLKHLIATANFCHTKEGNLEFGLEWTDAMPSELQKMTVRKVFPALSRWLKPGAIRTRVMISRMTKGANQKTSATSTARHAMIWHLDNNIRQPCLSFVYTWYSLPGMDSRTAGGSLLHSIKPDGLCAMTGPNGAYAQSNSYGNFYPGSNSAYVMFGSHVQHAVTPVVATDCVRYAVVAFLPMKKDMVVEAKITWGRSCPSDRPLYFCDECATCSKSAEALKKHFQKFHGGVPGGRKQKLTDTK
jgi:hypothetical protein